MDDYKDFEMVLKNLSMDEDSFEEDVMDEYDKRREEHNLDSLEDFIKNAKKAPSLSEERLQELVTARDAGDESAVNLIVEANLKLVLHYASRYAQNKEELQDFFQEGVTGLMRAAQDYSLAKGCKFSTYATYWIIEAMQKLRARTEKTVHISLHGLHTLKKILRVQEEYYKKNGTTLSLEELSNLFQLSPARIALLLTLDKSYSLNRTVSSEEADDSSSLIQFVPDSGKSVEEIVISKYDHGCFDDAQKILSEKEYTVLAYHFGLATGEPMSYAQIGRIMGRSREWIRQLEGRAIKKLQKNKRFVKKYGIKEPSS